MSVKSRSPLSRRASCVVLFLSTGAMVLSLTQVTGFAATVKKKIRLAPISGSEGHFQVLPKARKVTRTPASLSEPSLSLENAAPAESNAGSKSPPLNTKNLPVFKSLLTSEMVESVYPLPIRAGKNFYVAVGGDFSLTVLDRQVATLSVGYQKSFIDLFLRGKFGQTRWGLIEARPGTAEGFETTNALGDPYPAYADPTSEYNRVRTPEDVWSVLDVQVGVGGKANLLPVLFPQFSQGFYVTLATGSYSDTVNNLKFTPLILGFEAALQYHLGQGKRWAIEGRAAYQYGVLRRVDVSTASLGYLPVRWFDMGLSLVLWF